jgi:hypothetical protein
MATLSILHRLGNAAAALFGKHGDITARAAALGCSRQTVYDHAATVAQAVTDAQLPGPSRADLLDENRRLRAENQQLRHQLVLAQQHAAHTIPFGTSQRLRLAVITSAMGLSLNQIEDLFLILLGSAANAPDRATIGRWVLAQARRTGQLLQVLDDHTGAQLRHLCVDEIFFRQQPVLMAVEPFSMAWVLGQRSKDRTGATWCQALVPFANLEFAQSDQGTGLQKGLRLLAQGERTSSPV